MARAFLFVLDSFGIGGAPDAAAFGDAGADTYGHIWEACAAGKADRPGLRSGPLSLPNLDRLGLAHAANLSTGLELAPDIYQPSGLWGAAEEVSKGKDTPSGHWEIAGVPVSFDWGYFPQTIPAFPAELVAEATKKAAIPGVLGEKHASGTEIIDEFGEEHIRSGKPIFYTSTDSVLQIAAHETHFGLERLYELCGIVRDLVDPLNIGRVIARPFIGDKKGEFTRTGNRRDYSVLPPEPTLLDRLKDSGRKVIAIGKIGDIFAHQGISEVRKANGNMALFDTTLDAMDDAGDGDLVFTNFVDFDMLYGHRRDVAGYAAALEAFDRRLPEALGKLREGDLLVITADHGCDPTFRGTDHTRERVPVLCAGPGLPRSSLGVRRSFADIGETIAAHLGAIAGPHGRSFLGGSTANA
ncbi:phosphopentomutase [Phyllobacterium sp. 0TCS1.6C]|uniref:phosphopentomutase n=1 Tax=unclassified Phyllobacterium TaxID=2638441 RepID=UPI002263B929|nr:MULTISPECIES: phosphopentomutase [unclassified Phyllobacterium]MCX8281855.1 phosphopentomutase [Phyllobacterium sp. 0TCS1.6C]MCX8295390.1 phosphopentomutase [Phyllobacterium sp. 0TCS1.6A]